MKKILGKLIKPRFGLIATVGSSLMLATTISHAQAQEFLVGLKSSSETLTPQIAQNFARKLSVKGRVTGQIMGYNSPLHAYRISLGTGADSSATLQALHNDPQIAYVEPNIKLQAMKSDPSAPNDPWFPQQYAMTKIGAVSAWSLWKPTNATVVAVLDTGVDVAHPDLTNSIYRNESGAVVGTNLTQNTNGFADGNGHGTFCAGEIAAQANNGLGVAGVAGLYVAVPSGSVSIVKVMPVKVLSDDGSGYLSWVCDGITWAVDHGAKVISMSLGAASSSDSLTSAVAYANSHGCFVVAAAGNDGVSTKFYPAATPGVLSVGATNAEDRLTSFSNFGEWVKIAAPGESILSTLPNNQYGTGSGTSMACPIVAACAAVIRAQLPNLTNEQISNFLTTNTDAYSPYNNNAIATGAGRVNLYKALNAALGNGNPTSTTPTVTLTGLTLQWGEVPGGSALTGKVTLSGGAPTGGATIALTSDSTATTLPLSSVTVKAGEKSAYFALQTQQVNESTTTHVTVGYNSGSLTATLKVVANKIASFTIDPRIVVGGKKSRATLTLAIPAPSGGTVITLGANNSCASLPTSIRVPAGARRVSVEFSTSVVTALQTVQCSATLNGATKTADLIVKTPR